MSYSRRGGQEGMGQEKDRVFPVPWATEAVLEWEFSRCIISLTAQLAMRWVGTEQTALELWWKWAETGQILHQIWHTRQTRRHSWVHEELTFQPASLDGGG